MFMFAKIPKENIASLNSQLWALEKYNIRHTNLLLATIRYH
jgi:hypothetical protein